MNPKVDFFFSENKKWHKELSLLRAIPLECGLAEELKWGTPCYTLNGKNVVLLHDFKAYCAFLFFKGALLKNEDNLLVQQSDHVQAARHLRFTGLAEIKKLQPKIKALIFEAIEAERAGLKVKLKKTSDFEVAEEFQARLDGSHLLKTAFEKLTPGRQRGYLLFFSSARQSKTREARIDKYIPQILAGKGMDD